MSLRQLVAQLRAAKGIQHKLDIQPVRAMLERGAAWPQSTDVLVGDDCAAIPDGEGHLLLAIEGLLGEFVQTEPWFAGYCAVMVNVSDVYAMGGRPLALVDAVWTRDLARCAAIWEGMVAASHKYAVPIVGGHTNARNPGGDYLAAAILGRAKSLLTSFDAKPGDALVAAIDLRGEWFGRYPYWNASTAAEGPRLRADLELLPQLAEDGLCSAAKDISMGGIVGTAAMLAECSGVGLTLDITRVPRPAHAPIDKWLTMFPSFGFLLAVAPHDVRAVCHRFAARGITAAAIGACDDSNRYNLTDGAATHVFWDFARNPFLGLNSSPRSAGAL